MCSQVPPFYVSSLGATLHRLGVWTHRLSEMYILTGLPCPLHPPDPGPNLTVLYGPDEMPPPGCSFDNHLWQSSLSGSVLGPGSPRGTGRQDPHPRRAYKSLFGSNLVLWCLKGIHWSFSYVTLTLSAVARHEDLETVILRKFQIFSGPQFSFL